MLVITRDNDTQQVFDYHLALRCPHCGVQSNLSAVSIPRYEYAIRFQTITVGIVYRCDSCNAPVFLHFEATPDGGNNRLIIHEDSWKEVERASETFDFEYLPESVASDFRETLTCYSQLCLNAFAAMCRRTVQSTSANLGADGKDKVLTQLTDLKEMAQIDDDTFTVLRQVVIDGHDGAHPNLPSLNPERAAVLLELMKDVLYQLYVRKGKLNEAMLLRRQAIEQEKGE